MDILEFLFSNIFILVAIIWFLSGLFGKKNQEEQQRRRNPRPVARPVETPPEQNPVEFEIPWEKVEQDREIPSYSQQQIQYEEMHRKLEEVQRKKELISQTPVSDGLVHEPFHYSERSKQILDFSAINQTKVVQGMVWSQVFGLPRAKEPHRTSPYTKYRRKL